MIYSLRGAVATIGFVAIIGAYAAIDRGVNYKEAKASVFLIDRKCDFVETTTSSDGKKTARGLTDSCSSSDEWGTVREKRTKFVSGKAVVHVSYTAPQDGSSRTSKLHFNGRDDEFYEIKAGDEINVLVSNDDPSKIIKS